MYWQVAKHYNENGLLQPHQYSSVRLYLYPLILSVVLRAAEAMSWNASYLLAIFQYVIYLLSCAALTNAVSQTSRMKTAVFAALSCNIFLIPYVALSLSDSLSVALVQFFIVAMLNATKSSINLRVCGWLSVAGFLAGASMEIRPAYVWLPVMGLTVIVFANRDWHIRANLMRVFHTLLFVTFAVIPMIPQIAINSANYQSLTPLPAGNLQSAQLLWGKQHLKYATRLTAGVPPQIFYRNPFYDEDEIPGTHPTTWYLNHPISAMATITAKTVAAFDFDFIEPYVYHPHPPLQSPLRILSLTLFFLGICGIFARLFNLLSLSKSNLPRWLPFALLIGWVSVSLLSALELRFSLPLLSILLICTCDVGSALCDYSKRRVTVAFAITIVAVFALFTIADFTRQSLPFVASAN